MKKGFLISLSLHLILLVVAWVKFPDIFPEPEIKPLKVRLVSATEVKKTTKAELPKTKTQQSDAPAAPPKPKQEIKPEQHQAKKIVKAKKVVKKKDSKEPKKSVKKPEPIKKKEPKVAKVEKKVEPKKTSRPDKLDKTKNKQNLLKEQDKNAPDKKLEDDFLAALSFIDDLEKSKSNALEEGDDTDPTVVNTADMIEVAKIKRHIERNWFRPPGVKDLDKLMAVVEVQLSRDGTIENLKIIKSSDQPFYDNSLLRAIRKAVPIPIPQNKYDVYKVLELRFAG